MSAELGLFLGILAPGAMKVLKHVHLVDGGTLRKGTVWSAGENTPCGEK